MKLRLHGDSIRFRLGKSEVQRLLRDASIEEATHFPNPGKASGNTPNNASLIFELQATDAHSPIRCLFEHNRLTVQVPRDVLEHWAATEEVSIRGSQPLNDRANSSLKILIEKDFQCMDGAGSELDEDAFANPRQTAVT